MTKKKRPLNPAAITKPVENYSHPTANGSHVPDAGAEPFIKSNHPPGKYRYDSSLSPSLEWDEGNPAREGAESLIREILEAGNLEAAKEAAEKLKAMSAPFLNWAGKAERPNLEVPTLPLFVHERLSTKGIIETLKGHRRNKNRSLLDFFNDPQLSFGEQATKAYEHGPWSNRMILGDNLHVMNWLLRGENMGGQVQMIYMDPPYGIKYGSNFQPFVRKREVKNNDDDDMTREPEMVQAYRDTWKIGLHSYLTHVRDRLTLARDLLHPSGSVFVQISDENLHHVREILDESFGSENFVCLITFAKTTQFSGKTLSSIADYIVWYAKDLTRIKYRPLYRLKEAGEEGASKYRPVSTIRSIPDGRFPADRLATTDQLTSQGESQTDQSFEFMERIWRPPAGMHWKTSVEGLKKLAEKKGSLSKALQFVLYVSSMTFPLFRLPTFGQISEAFRTEQKESCTSFKPQPRQFNVASS